MRGEQKNEGHKNANSARIHEQQTFAAQVEEFAVRVDVSTLSQRAVWNLCHRLRR